MTEQPVYISPFMPKPHCNDAHACGLRNALVRLRITSGENVYFSRDTYEHISPSQLTILRQYNVQFDEGLPFASIRGDRIFEENAA